MLLSIPDHVCLTQCHCITGSDIYFVCHGQGTYASSRTSGLHQRVTNQEACMACMRKYVITDCYLHGLEQGGARAGEEAGAARLQGGGAGAGPGGGRTEPPQFCQDCAGRYWGRAGLPHSHPGCRQGMTSAHAMLFIMMDASHSTVSTKSSKGHTSCLSLFKSTSPAIFHSCHVAIVHERPSEWVISGRLGACPH